MKTTSMPDATAAPDFPPARVGWKAVAVLMALYIVSMLDRNIITLLGAAIQQDIGLTDFELSLIYGPAFALFYAGAGLPLGWAVDQFRRRNVIFSMVVLWSFSSLACGFAGSFLSLFTARAGVGSGEAVLHPASQSMLSDLFPPGKLAFAMSVYSVGAKAGQSISFLIGGALATIIAPLGLYALPWMGIQLSGWQAILLIISLPGFLLAALIYLIPEPARRLGHPSDGNMTYLRYLGLFVRRWRFFLFHHLGTVMFLSAFWSVSAWAPAYLERVHHMSTSEVGGLLGVALFVGSMIGMPLHGYLVDRLYRRGVIDAPLRYLVAVALLSLPVGVAAMMVQNPFLSVILIGLFVGAIAAYASLPQVALQIVIPGNARGRAAAVMLLFTGFAGMSIGPVAVGLVNDLVFGNPDKVGLSIAICVALFLPLASLCFALTLSSYREALYEKGLSAV